MDDFTNLEQTRHMLEWLADDPYQAIRSKIEDTLRQQVADSVLESLRVTSQPQWLTGARRTEEDNDKAILVRTAVVFEFELAVASGGQLHSLSGTFSWAGINLDDPENRQQRIWFDLGGTLAEFGSQGELANRIYFA